MLKPHRWPKDFLWRELHRQRTTYREIQLNTFALYNNPDFYYPVQKIEISRDQYKSLTITIIWTDYLEISRDQYKPLTITIWTDYLEICPQSCSGKS